MSTFLLGSDYLQLEGPSTPWIIRDLLPVSGKINIYGRPKIGKSFMALQMAMAITTRKLDFLGLPIDTPGPVAYLQLDTARGVWRRNFLEKVQEGGYDPTLIWYADREIAPYPFNILGEGGTWLKLALRALPEFPLAVVVDTFREMHGADENDSGVMRNVMNALVEATFPAALITLSHQRKMHNDQVADLMSDGRGSTYVAGAMDAVARVSEREFMFQSRSEDETPIHLTRKKKAAGGFGVWELDPRSGILKEIVAAGMHAQLNQADMVRQYMAAVPTISLATAKRHVGAEQELHG